MSRSRRLLCRLGVHRYVALGPGLAGRHPCLTERTCRGCEHVTASRLTHDFTRERLTDPCHGFDVCGRCEYERPTLRHDHRWTRVLDLPPAHRPRLQSGDRFGPCDEVEVCDRCEAVGFQRTEHDFDEERTGGQCRRCRERWLLNDA